MPVALLTGSKSAAGLGGRDERVPETAGARSLPALGGAQPPRGGGLRGWSFAESLYLGVGRADAPESFETGSYFKKVSRLRGAWGRN